MKLDKVSTLIVAATIIIAVLFFFQKSKSIKPQQIPEAHNVLESVTVGRVNTIAKSAAPEKAPTVIEKADLTACGRFLNNQSALNLNETVQTIMKQSSHKETLERTEYQLISNDNREIIVQHTPDEESKNKIRVLRVANDGFPDRIKNFPRSKGSTEDQLQGALTLGVLKNKIEKYSVMQESGVLLKFDKSQNQVIRINYSNGRNQLLCEESKCSCHSF